MAQIIRVSCAVGLTACLSAVVAVGVLLALRAYLCGSGEWLADVMARRRWGHDGR